MAAPSTDIFFILSQYLKATERVNALEAGIRQAVADLRAEHRPYTFNMQGPDDGPAWVVMQVCKLCTAMGEYANFDDSWPCPSALVADKLETLIGGAS